MPGPGETDVRGRPVAALATGLLAAYQIVYGVEGAEPLAMWAYTIAFGVLLLAGLLLIILGFEALASPVVVIAATAIPLSLSLGLVWEYLPAWRTPYLAFAVAGFGAVALSRLAIQGKRAALVLAVVHGVAGLLIFGLPLLLALGGVTGAGSCSSAWAVRSSVWPDCCSPS